MTLAKELARLRAEIEALPERGGRAISDEEFRQMLLRAHPDFAAMSDDSLLAAIELDRKCEELMLHHFLQTGNRAGSEVLHAECAARGLMDELFSSMEPDADAYARSLDTHSLHSELRTYLRAAGVLHDEFKDTGDLPRWIAAIERELAARERSNKTKGDHHG